MSDPLNLSDLTDTEHQALLVAAIEALALIELWNESETGIDRGGE